MAIHSSILAWRIPWTEEPGGLQSMSWTRLKRLSSSRVGEGTAQEPFLPHAYLLTLSQVGTARRTPENLPEIEQGCYR